jgi:amino acid transporter
VIFMAVANAAPITAISGNVPIAVGFGNGLGAPAGFLFATIALTLFALGYVAMAKHITTTGAFYGFISHGLGQIWGMASGLLATFAYVIFEGSSIGGCAYFANDAVNTIVRVNIPWLVFAIGAILIIGALCHFQISLTAAVLGVTLVSEVLVLFALAFSVIFKGGRPDGFMLNQAVLLNNAFESLPAGAFGTAAAAGSMAIGLFFAFWSWVGFETTAVYGEESRNPKKIIPRATLIAVIGLGLFHTFISAMVLAGNGAKTSVETSISASPLDLFFGLVEANLGTFLLDVYKVLLVIGSFACALAFHNAASRYLYALGREIPSSAVRSTVGATHAKHGSPYIASAVQAGITLVIVLLFAGFTAVQVPDAKRRSGGHPVAGALHQHTRPAGIDRHGGDPAGAGHLLGGGDLVLLGAKDPPEQREYHAHRFADRRCGDAVRGVAAVGQPRVRRGLCRQLAGVQGRPVHHPGGVRARSGVRSVDAGRQAGGLRGDRPHGHGGLARTQRVDAARISEGQQTHDSPARPDVLGNRAAFHPTADLSPFPRPDVTVGRIAPRGRNDV